MDSFVLLLCVLDSILYDFCDDFSLILGSRFDEGILSFFSVVLSPAISLMGLLGSVGPGQIELVPGYGQVL
jgi:hypothetical protein